MLNLNGTEVLIARMHTGTHIEGIGSIPSTIDATVMKSKKIQLYLCDYGILVKYLKNGAPAQVLLHNGNLISSELKVSEKNS